jgi:hypothetical protein
MVRETVEGFYEQTKAMNIMASGRMTSEMALAGSSLRKSGSLKAALDMTIQMALGCFY